MDLTKLTLDEIFLLLHYVDVLIKEGVILETQIKLESKKDKLRQEILNRIDKI